MKPLIVLDFDGVLCDSLAETLSVSWDAYHRLRGDRPASAPRHLKEGFARLRPFLRAGEDFLAIHKILDRGERLADQRAFDQELARESEEELKAYKELFYQARSLMMETEREAWLRLNPLYPVVREHLASWLSAPNLNILSTKKPEYILEILDANRIKGIPERVLFSSATGKPRIISEMIDRSGRRQAFFLDDQIDHLLAARKADERIEVKLASWGYVRAEWLDPDSTVESLSLDELPAFLAPRLET